MSKFRLGAVIAGIALTAAIASPAFAIKNAGECTAEGGQMLTVKGSDFCLVPIRDKAYAGPEYDGNQLGVVECPGSKLNDGAYCMYPVTLRKNAGMSTTTQMTNEDMASGSVTTAVTTETTEKVPGTDMPKAETTVITTTAPSATDEMVDTVIDKAAETAKDEN